MYRAPLVVRFFGWLYRDSVTCPDFRPRDRPMEILALGVSRSGTDSLKQALEELGYKHTYHGWDAMLFPEHNAFWREAMKAKFEGGKKLTRDDWDRIFGNCMAISDLPAIAFAEELIEAYPEAKVILSTRDVDSWYRSVSATVNAQVNHYPQRFTQLFHPLLFQYNVFYTIYNYFFRGSFERNGKIVYEEHNAMIRRLVPNDRLLEYHVREGWKPLCEWLGKEIPNTEVPHVNFGADFKAKVRVIQLMWVREVLRNMAIFFGAIVGVGAVTSIWIKRLLRPPQRMGCSRLK